MVLRQDAGKTVKGLAGWYWYSDGNRKGTRRYDRVNDTWHADCLKIWELSLKGGFYGRWIRVDSGSSVFKTNAAAEALQPKRDWYICEHQSSQKALEPHHGFLRIDTLECPWTVCVKGYKYVRGIFSILIMCSGTFCLRFTCRHSMMSPADS